MAFFETRLWWAMLERDLSERWGALANARAAVARDRLMAAQRSEAERALARLRAAGRRTQAS